MKIKLNSELYCGILNNKTYLSWFRNFRMKNPHFGGKIDGKNLPHSYVALLRSHALQGPLLKIIFGEV